MVESNRMVNVSRQPRRPKRRRRTRTYSSGSQFRILGNIPIPRNRQLIPGTVCVILTIGLTAWIYGILKFSVSARTDFIELLGLGVFYAPSLAIISGIWILAGTNRPSLVVIQRSIGIGCLACFGIGAAGFFFPSWILADVPISAISAGGSVGNIASSPAGIFAMLGAVLSAALLIAPKPTIRALAIAGRSVIRVCAPLITKIVLSISKKIHSMPLKQSLRYTTQLSWVRKAYTLIRYRVVREESYNLTETGDENPIHALSEFSDEVPSQQELTSHDENIVLDAQRKMAEDFEDVNQSIEIRNSADGWTLPPIELLNSDKLSTQNVNTKHQAEIIIETLASFGVDAVVTQINSGPTVTQFGIEPGWDIKTRQVSVRDDRGALVLGENGIPLQKDEEISRTRVRVSRITRLVNDIALALAAPAVRIEAPVPGQSVIGLEVPNLKRNLVSARGVLETEEFRDSLDSGGIPVALGRDVRGNPIVADLTTMPHILIAGATGSGKSVCVNSIITSILMNHSPEHVRMILIDPKRVELTEYGEIPHLAFSHVVTDPDEVVGVLAVAVAEMEKRYRRFEAIGARIIAAYNATVNSEEKIPFWVVILDELADLMMAAPVEVAQQVVRLAPLARATGIHLVVATQRPSVDVVTGLIKANFPTRIAFATSSQTDARVILDHAGAEKLLGQGDMLFMNTKSLTPLRLQGTFVSDEEISKLIAFWTQNRFKNVPRPTLDHLLHETKTTSPTAKSSPISNPGDENGDTKTSDLVNDHDLSVMKSDRETDSLPTNEAEQKDSLYDQAVALAEQHTRISSSMIQRRLRVGYPRAVRLINQLEENGVVAASDGGQSRKVLIEHIETL